MDTSDPARIFSLQQPLRPVALDHGLGGHSLQSRGFISTRKANHTRECPGNLRRPAMSGSRPGKTSCDYLSAARGGSSAAGRLRASRQLSPPEFTTCRKNGQLGGGPPPPTKLALPLATLIQLAHWSGAALPRQPVRRRSNIGSAHAELARIRSDGRLCRE